MYIEGTGCSVTCGVWGGGTLGVWGVVLLVRVWGAGTLGVRGVVLSGCGVLVHWRVQGVVLLVGVWGACIVWGGGDNDDDSLWGGVGGDDSVSCCMWGMGCL